MKKNAILFCLLALLLSFSMLLVGCDSSTDTTGQGNNGGDNTSAACSHEWSAATCTKPKTCKLCKDTDGSALGHTWEDADCDNPKTCTVCEETKGSALGHDWINATCESAKTCSVCHKKQGEALGHSWVKATCEKAKTCSVCNSTEGAPLGHTWTAATCAAPKTCSACSATEGVKLAHTWTAATCTAPKTCSACSATEGEKLAHDYKEEILITASCAEKGKKSFSCKNCTHNYTEEYALPAYEPEDIYEIAMHSVGEITTYSKSGSAFALGTGFVYSADGKIITNYHVLEDAYSAEIVLNGQTYQIKQVLAYSKKIDLAVVKIDATGLVPLPICKNAHSVGKTVYALGSSKGLTGTFSSGMISYDARELDDVLYVQHNAPISSGNSGGPLIDIHGDVIGINTWTVRDSQNLNFAISVNELDHLTYGTPITMSQFYERESDVFEKLKSYAIANGKYDSADREYTVTLYSGRSGDAALVRSLVYDAADDEIYLTLFMVTSDISAILMITIDKVDGTYSWAYLDGDDHYMYGPMTASTFTSNTLAAVTNYTGIYTTSMRDSVRKLASAMIINIAQNLTDDLDAIGVTAADLGFSNFS